MLSFGTIAQGTTSPGQTFTVTNNELAPVSIDGFAFAGANPGDFKVASDTCHGEVEALTTCTASVRFVPQAEGTRTATLTALIDGLPDPAATALSGTAGPLPQGPAGATGLQGPAGSQGPAGDSATKLFLAFAAAKQTSKAGKKVALPYVATTKADATLEVRKGSKLLATVEADAAEGRNTISWDGKDASGKKPKAGRARHLHTRTRGRVARRPDGERFGEADGEEEVIRRRLHPRASPPWSRARHRRGRSGDGLRRGAGQPAERGERPPRRSARRRQRRRLGRRRRRPDNDGIDDVIVGAAGADNSGRRTRAAHVVYGRATPGTVNLASLGSGGFRIDGQAASDNAGVSVAAAGDPNNDGIDDVIVGASKADNNGTDSGSAYVVHGQSTADPADVGAGNAGRTRFPDRRTGGE